MLNKMDSIQDDHTQILNPSNTAVHSLKRARTGHEITARAIKTPAFSYVCLELMSDGAAPPALDDLSVKSYLTSGLSQFLGLTGSAISVDILKVEDKACWIRVPREDLSAVLAATGQWASCFDGSNRMAWRLRASGNWLGSILGATNAQNVWRG